MRSARSLPSGFIVAGRTEWKRDLFASRGMRSTELKVVKRPKAMINSWVELESLVSYLR